jgi:hypothetical protein
MPTHRSDGRPPSARSGRVKAASRPSGSAPALALTRTMRADNPETIRSTLTAKTVAPLLNPPNLSHDC